MAAAPAPSASVVTGREQESDLMERLPKASPEEAAKLGGGAFPEVSLVSLGCYCGPKLTFQRMGRGAETLPFDWIRTTHEGVLHFLTTDFEGFYDFLTQKPVPGCTAMTMYRSHHHSFWHDDPTDPGMHERYERRFQRFRDIDASSRPVLFVRVAADAQAELAGAPDLAAELAARFGPRAALLLVLNFQEKRQGATLIEVSSEGAVTPTRAAANLVGNSEVGRHTSCLTVGGVRGLGTHHM
jgi:hypothetical protein